MIGIRHAAMALGLAAWFATLGLAAAPAPEDVVPKLAGTWTWKWKDAAGETHKHTLELEGENDKLTGRERFDDKPAVKVENLKLDGKNLSFASTHGKRRSEYKGKLGDSDTINGTVSVSIEGQASEFGWTATREAGKGK
ncbi:hypothetical protein TA3x_003543 [Tundrisphaera sp. TA3]|uniref:hypothetical protein n=1 Tax=Tundrisphaera sp. TA3 TaxID=3435775 RepID=UPI003EB832B6